MRSRAFRFSSKAELAETALPKLASRAGFEESRQDWMGTQATAARATGATLLALAVALLPAGASASPGDLDPTFSKDGMASIAPELEASPSDVAVQPDGRIIAAGFTRSDDGTIGAAVVARIDHDGTVDRAFAGGQLTRTFGFQTATVSSAEMMPDGRIVLLGSGRSDAESMSFVARLLPNGELDPTFAESGVATLRPELFASAIALFSDGSVAVGGSGSTSSAEKGARIAKLTPSGAEDLTFSGDGYQLVSPTIAPIFTALEVDPTGGVVAAGAFSEAQFRAHMRVVRVRPDGELDPSYADGGVRIIRCESECASGRASELAWAPDGGLIAAATLSHVGGTVVPRYFPAALMAQLDPRGEIVPGPGEGGVWSPMAAAANDIAVSSDGRVAIADSARGPAMPGPNDPSSLALAQVLTDGTPDPRFGSDGRLVLNLSEEGEAISAIDRQADDRIVAIGLIAGGFTLFRFEVAPGPEDVDADEVRDSKDDCPTRFGKGPHGCRMVKARVSLDYGPIDSEGQKGFRGYLSYSDPGCFARGRYPRIYRVREGANKEIGKSTASDFPGSGERPGSFTLEESDAGGRYYARVRKSVEPTTGVCGAAKSRAVNANGRRPRLQSRTDVARRIDRFIYRSRYDELYGELVSRRFACAADEPIKIYEQRDGPDRLLDKTRSRSIRPASFGYSFESPPSEGERYRAVAPATRGPDSAICREASRRATVRP